MGGSEDVTSTSSTSPVTSTSSNATTSTTSETPHPSTTASSASETPTTITTTSIQIASEPLVKAGEETKDAGELAEEARAKEEALAKQSTSWGLTGLITLSGSCEFGQGMRATEAQSQATVTRTQAGCAQDNGSALCDTGLRSEVCAPHLIRIIRSRAEIVLS